MTYFYSRLFSTTAIVFFHFCFSFLQAQDCNGLRGANETYGAGDTNSSWCDIKIRTPYTDCMCSEEKNNKAVAQQIKTLDELALEKSTAASEILNQAHQLVNEARIEKDQSKANQAYALYDEAILLSNEAKSYITHKYADSNMSYNTLKNLHLKYYDRQIAYAKGGHDFIQVINEVIYKNENSNTTTPTEKNVTSKNEWHLKNTSKSNTPKNSIATITKPLVTETETSPEPLECSEWKRIYGTCLDTKGKSTIDYQVCFMRQTETQVIHEVTANATEIGIDAGFYKKGIAISTLGNEKITMSCSEFNKNGYTVEVKVDKQLKGLEWDNAKKAYLNTFNNTYEKYISGVYITCNY